MNIIHSVHEKEYVFVIAIIGNTYLYSNKKKKKKDQNAEKKKKKIVKSSIHQNQNQKKNPIHTKRHAVHFQSGSIQVIIGLRQPVHTNLCFPSRLFAA